MSVTVFAPVLPRCLGRRSIEYFVYLTGLNPEKCTKYRAHQGVRP
jgi:hypothetical protein